MQPLPPLADRSARALQPMLSYGAAFHAAKQDPWSADNPDGHSILSVAENKLTLDMLHAKIAGLPSPPASTFCYPASYRGTPEARAAMARMAGRTWMQGIRVSPDNLCLLAGAGAVLDVLFWLLCNPGEAVLIPGPIYPAFINDLTVRDSTVPVVFNLHEPDSNQQGSEQHSIPVERQLDAVQAAQAAQGRAVRALLITNPNNPLGTIYKPETVLAMAKWCLKNGVHLVSDEVYANSVFGEGASFESAEVLLRRESVNMEFQLAERIPELLHIIFGMSKDFCASGLRIGVLHTRNRAILQAMENHGYFHCCSNHTQWLVAQALSDDAWLDSFIAENKIRLRNSYETLTEAMSEAGVPFLPACAAMFLWIDLSAWLPEPTWEAEADVWRELIESRVLFTPGEACKAERPGFFRVCWAWVPKEGLFVAVARLRKVLDGRRKRMLA